MKFNEWQKKVEDLQEKIQDVALVPITESIYVDGKTVVITLDKGQLHVDAGGSPTALRYLRHDYTHAKEEFDDLLEALQKSASEILESSNEILLAVTEEEIPAAVIARMSGQQINGDTPELLEKMVERKAEYLLKKLDKTRTFETFNFKVKVGSGTLEFERDYNGPRIHWGNVQINKSGVSSGDVRQNLKFLGKFEAISGVLERFCILMETFKSLGS